jgi:hypothetical protein
VGGQRQAHQAKVTSNKESNDRWRNGVIASPRVGTSCPKHTVRFEMLGRFECPASIEVNHYVSKRISRTNTLIRRRSARNLSQGRKREPIVYILCRVGWRSHHLEDFSRLHFGALVNFRNSKIASPSDFYSLSVAGMPHKQLRPTHWVAKHGAHKQGRSNLCVICIL